MNPEEKEYDTAGLTGKLPAVLWNDGNITKISDTAAREEEIVLHLNDREYLHIVASRDMLREFGAGFFIAAGVAKKIISVEVTDRDVFVEAEVFPGTGPREGFAPAEKKVMSIRICSSLQRRSSLFGGLWTWMSGDKPEVSTAPHYGMITKSSPWQAISQGTMPLTNSSAS